MNSMMTLIPLVLLFVVMYFLLIRPQKKREKETAAMRSSLRVGDEIITIGGIKGKIVKTKDESLVIQVGADKVKFEIMRWSVSKVENPSTAPVYDDDSSDSEEDDAPAKKSRPKRIRKANPAEDEAADKAEEAPVENGDAPAEDSADKEEEK